MIGRSTNSLSLIAPCWNERTLIPQWVDMILQQKESPLELIVVDGGSTDGSWEWLQKHPQINAFQTTKGRAQQLHFGAKKASGALLFFVHIDTQLPLGFDGFIKKAFSANALSGCFRLRFSPHNPLGLRLAAWGTRWNHLLFRGGDQTLFIHRELYHQIGGFDANYGVCEDLELIRHIYRNSTFTILPQEVVTNSRRFQQKGTSHLLFHFRVLHFLHWLGAGPKILFAYYQKFVA
ncbi:MAG: TIGR04283 family arsenosugar biosynthesis glycosyltransferase [Flavobacteriaceae bacterium]